MKRIIINLIVILLAQQFSAAAAFGDETCELNREMEHQCRSYTYSVVKPMLDYLRQVGEDLLKSESKDRIIKELREKLVQQEMNDALIKELRSEIDFQKRIDSLSTNSKLIENYAKCKDELASKSIKLGILDAQLSKLNSKEITKINTSKNDKSEFEDLKVKMVDKSNKLEVCEVQLMKLNASLIEKDKSISIYMQRSTMCQNKNKKIELQLKDRETKLVDKENYRQMCQAEIDKLNKTVYNNIPSSCFPYAENPGVHKIEVSGFGFINVVCNSQIAGPGWIVIQQRVGGSESFDRDWATYRKGFGSMDSDFFLGLEKIHRLTNSRRHELYLHLVARDDTKFYTRYDDFKISDEDTGYALSLVT
ncbi:angiopoietin-2-like isoform X2 [Drosophila nasuta]|uniref:angiopoietin-2-like isoform X2 n=1 Tax=Drosophila nasuta TaxID=42062 RepID=UPI00295EC57B|nr:angiopoietin-2-like isoform X2 [Drosophila nasuta]